MILAKELKVAVIGAGPAGMTAAYVLAKAGVSVTVFEAGESVGGLAKTITLWNQRVDFGPHRFFSKDSRVNSLWLEVVGKDYSLVNRLSRIYHRNTFFYYPLRPFNVLGQLGAIESIRCVLSYFKSRLFPQPDESSFENWVVNRFGRRLFKIFFKSYCEKVWGIPGKELNADFAAQRIKKLSLGEAIKNALFAGQKNSHKTLIDQFAYPHAGCGIVYERMADYVNLKGGSVCCKTPVQKLCLEERKVVGVELTDGSFQKFDYVISSMPLTLLVLQLPNLPQAVKKAAEALKFRNTIIVYLNVDSENLFPDNWLYIHSESLQLGRMTNFRNWVPELYGEEKSTILALEYWCNDSDDLWHQADDALIQLAHQELASTKLLGQAQVIEGKVMRIHRSYPVYSPDYQTHLECIRQYLEGIENLSVIGRYGAFKYNNQDHSILMGLLAAENILYGPKHNLWDINTDYDDYQEASRITETGLVKI